MKPKTEDSLHSLGATLLGVLGDYEEHVGLLSMAEAMVNIGYWRVYTGSGELRWSPQVHRIHGTDPASFRPRIEDGLRFYHAEDRPMVARAVEEAVLGGTSFDFEARLIRADGVERIVHSVGQTVQTAQGHRDIFGVFQDITEQRALVDRLAESEARYELAIAASQDGLWDWDLTTDALWWSDRFMAHGRGGGAAGPGHQDERAGALERRARSFRLAGQPRHEGTLAKGARVRGLRLDLGQRADGS